MTTASMAQGTDGAQVAGWLQRVAQGDVAAFESLYRETSPRLFGVCLRVLPDRAEAEDVLQEVYTTIWRKAAQFDAARAGALTWMAMIARNRAIDRLRAGALPGRRTGLDDAGEIVDTDATPAQQAEAANEGQRLGACLDQLEPRRRGLIRTAFFEGATYEELATRSGSPLGSVKSWIRRGLLQLRACLEQTA